MTATCSISAQRVFSVLQLTYHRFQQKKQTIGDCNDELMLGIEQFTLLLDGEDQYRKHTVSNADAGRDKAHLFRG